MPKSKRRPSRTSGPAKGRGNARTDAAPNPLRKDPSRTLDLRKKFEASLRKKFNRVRFLVLELIVKEDAFGLGKKPDTFANAGIVNATRIASASLEVAEAYLDAMCGGPGSGVPGPCPSGKVGFIGRMGGKVSAIADKVPGVAQVKAGMQKAMKAVHSRLEARYGAKVATTIMTSGALGGYGVAGAAFLVTGVPGIPVVNDIISIAAHTAVAEVAYRLGFIKPARSGNHRYANANALTQVPVATAPDAATIALLSWQARITLTRELQRIETAVSKDVEATLRNDPALVDEVKGVIKAYRDEDGIVPSPITEVTNTRWAFRPNPDKLRAFQEWLRSTIDNEVLSDRQLWDEYIRQGFERGGARAFDDTRGVRQFTDSPDFYRGSRSEFLRSSFNRPISLERVQMLAGRTFTEMEGLTEEMVRTMSRTLTDGLVQGINPRELGRTLADSVGISRSRATTIARTEIIRAHAEGQLQSLEDLGVEEVGVMVEWSTSGLGITAKGNESPCPLCAPMQGVVLRIDEARGMIPRHPNCMCAFVPANVGEATDEQKRGKDSVERALKQSKDEGATEWGPNTPISRSRPESIVDNTNIITNDSSTLRAIHAFSRWLTN